LARLREHTQRQPGRIQRSERPTARRNPIPIATRIVDQHYIKTVAGIRFGRHRFDYDGVPLLPDGMNGMEDLALVTYEMPAIRKRHPQSVGRKPPFERAERYEKLNTRKISGEGSFSESNKLLQSLFMISPK